jgi:hypothetical protein
MPLERWRKLDCGILDVNDSAVTRDASRRRGVQEERAECEHATLGHDALGFRLARP